jgi:AraC-like DNA-binding protein
MDDLSGHVARDPLSDLLRDVRFKSTLWCRSELSAPWGFSVAGRDVASFHVVEHGECVLSVDGLADPIALAAGDLVLLPHGASHAVRDSAGSPVTRLDELLALHQVDDRRMLHVRGRGPSTVLLCGGFFFENRSTLPLLGALPPVIHVAASPGTVTWVRLVEELLAREVQAARSGGNAVLDRLADLLFIEAMRSYFDRAPHESRSWAAALRDRSIGAALTAIHRSPSALWSAESLAAEAGMSRSAFAARFSLLVGESPLRYTTRCRMNAAIRLLASRSLSISEIAAQVGYDSDVAFGRAFKRHVGLAPAAWRRSFERERNGEG